MEVRMKVHVFWVILKIKIFQENNSQGGLSQYDILKELGKI